jgi:hypothetical protein
LAPQNDQRLEALEARVANLAAFNQVLLDHLLQAQDFMGPGKPPNPQTVHRWVIDLSNSVWARYRGKGKL